jgi:DNA-binding NarL/FixJ family response regulator
MKGEIRIVIADNAPMIRDWLRQATEKDASLRLVAEATDGKMALAQIQETLPDIAILDIGMPEMNGFAVAREIINKELSVDVIFITIHNDEAAFEEALQLGAKGYLLKEECTISNLLSCIKAVAAGQHYSTPEMTTYLFNRSKENKEAKNLLTELATLTPSEHRILTMISEAKATKDIADLLHITPRAVEKHRENICKKLDIHGSHALLRFALENKRLI